MNIIKFPIYMLSISASLTMPAYAADSSDLESFFNDQINPQMQLCGVCHIPNGLADSEGGDGFLLYSDRSNYESFYDAWVELGEGVTNNRLLTMNSDPALNHTGSQNWPTTSEKYKNVKSLLTCWDQPTLCTIGPSPDSADLSLSMAGKNGQNNGGYISYSITVANAGPDTANTLEIVHQLPTQVALSAVEPNSIAYTSDGNEITFYLDSMETGTNQSIIVTVNTATNNSALMSFTTAVRAITVDSNLANNSSTASFGGITSNNADLSISMTGHNGKNQNGGINYSITVVNDGPADANTVEINHQLPAQVTLDTVTPSSIAYTSDGNEITFYLDSLAKGSSQSINITTNTATDNKDKMEFTASVSAVTEDPNPENNSSEAKFGGSFGWFIIAFSGLLFVFRSLKIQSRQCSSGYKNNN